MSETTERNEARSGYLEVLGPEGETTVAWQRDDATEIAAVQAEFERLLGSGYSAFVETEEGPEGPIREFDPQTKAYVLVPAIQGG